MQRDRPGEIEAAASGRKGLARGNEQADSDTLQGKRSTYSPGGVCHTGLRSGEQIEG